MRQVKTCCVLARSPQQICNASRICPLQRVAVAMAGAHAMLPVQIHHSIVPISGGHLRSNSKYSHLLMKVHDIDGVKCITLDKRDNRVSRFLGGDFSMVQYLISQRNIAMAAKVADEEESDPLQRIASCEVTPPTSKRQRMEVQALADTKWLTVKVGDDDVRLLGTADSRAMLTVELNTSNLGLLLQSPPACLNSLQPNLKYTHLRWLPNPGFVWGWYHDNTDKQWKRRTRKMRN